MQLPPLIANNRKVKNLTIDWKGLNRMPTVESGELSAMENTSSRYAPCLSPRPPREQMTSTSNGTSVLAVSDKLCWISGTNFVYDGAVKGAVTAGRKSMCAFNGKIIIMPDKKYYDYVSNTFGSFTAPDIDYIAVFNNRLVGVKGNDFRMSALGEYDEWEKFDGENTDSWATDTAEEGNFTGLLGLQTPNHIICTKSGYLYELYGSKPSNFSLTKIDDTGCIDFRSLVAIDNIAYFLSSEGVMQYAGGVCKNISINLREKYVSGAAGTDGRRYYISLYNGTETNLYSYDTYTGLWHREDDLQAESFAAITPNFYALTANSIIKFNSGSEQVNFSFETERFTEQYNGAKTMSEFSVMVEMTGYACVKAYYSVDDGEFIHADTILSCGFHSYVSNIKPCRGDSVKLRFEGFGDIKIHQLDRKMSIGSTVSIRLRALSWSELWYSWGQLQAFTWGEINHRRSA